MTTPILIKSFRVGLAAIAGYLIVKAAAEGKVAAASAPTDPLVGAATMLGAPAEGILDVDQAGWSEVRCGGNVSFGDPLTSNADAKAVKAVPVAGSVVRIIGFAMSDGSADDVIPYQVAPGVLSTPA